MGKTTLEEIEADSGVSIRDLIDASEIRGDDEDDKLLLLEASRIVDRYMSDQAWCKTILRKYFAYGVGGIVSIFLVEIIPSSSSVDRWLWVVVGDLPSAYLVTDDAPNAAAALESYIDLMEDWVESVENGDDLDNVFPVEAEPTSANAKALRNRLEYLESEILPVVSNKIY